MHFSVFKVLSDSNKFVEGLSKFYFSSYRTYIKGSIMIRLVLLTLYVYKYGILVQDNADITLYIGKLVFISSDCEQYV